MCTGGPMTLSGLAAIELKSNMFILFYFSFLFFYLFIYFQFYGNQSSIESPRRFQSVSQSHRGTNGTDL